MGRATRQDRRAGFTLVEMMAACLIGGILVVAIGGLLHSNQRSFEASRDRIRLQQAADLTLERIASAVRVAHSIRVVSDDHVQTVDRDGVQLLEFTRDGSGDDARVRRNGVDMADWSCTSLRFEPNIHGTCLKIELEMADRLDNRCAVWTWVTVRNRNL